MFNKGAGKRRVGPWLPWMAAFALWVLVNDVLAFAPRFGYFGVPHVNSWVSPYVHAPPVARYPVPVSRYAIPMPRPWSAHPMAYGIRPPAFGPRLARGYPPGIHPTMIWAARQMNRFAWPGQDPVIAAMYQPAHMMAFPAAYPRLPGTEMSSPTGRVSSAVYPPNKRRFQTAGSRPVSSRGMVVRVPPNGRMTPGTYRFRPMTAHTLAAPKPQIYRYKGRDWRFRPAGTTAPETMIVRQKIQSPDGSTGVQQFKFREYQQQFRNDAYGVSAGMPGSAGYGNVPAGAGIRYHSCSQADCRG